MCTSWRDSVYAATHEYMPICVNIINLAFKQQSVFTSHLQLIKSGYNIFLCASNLLQYNKKCSAFSVEYPQEQDGLCRGGFRGGGGGGAPFAPPP